MGLNLEEKVDGHEIVEDEKHGGVLEGYSRSPNHYHDDHIPHMLIVLVVSYNTLFIQRVRNPNPHHHHRHL
jgi:hypothetical protein